MSKDGIAGINARDRLFDFVSAECGKGELLTASGALLEAAHCSKSEDRKCMPCFPSTLPLVSVKSQLSTRRIIFVFASAEYAKVVWLWGWSR